MLSLFTYVISINYVIYSINYVISITYVIYSITYGDILDIIRYKLPLPQRPG